MRRRKREDKAKRYILALKLWGEGLTKREISTLLGISERTVYRQLSYWVKEAGYQCLVKAYMDQFRPTELDYLKDVTREINLIKRLMF